MSSSEYVAPQVSELGEKATNPAVKQANASMPPKSAVKPAAKETSVSFAQQKEIEVVGISKMVNAKGNTATDIMLERINKHMRFLSGKEGFANAQAQMREQVTFIETIGNSLKLDFPQFVVVADTLLKVIRENQKVFDDGLAFRFMKGLDKKYPPQVLRSYQTYMNFLAKVAGSWAARHKLSKLIDLTYVINDLDKKAKENVTRYFRYLSNV